MNDLVGPHVPKVDVLAVLAAAGVPVIDRSDPVGTSVRAVVTSTAAGTVVTLQRRGSLFVGRTAVRRRLVHLWDDLAWQWEHRSPGPCKPS